MARIHARKRGRSSSTRPPHTMNPKWANQDAKEIEELIVKMAKEGMSTSLIGIRLRDHHNVPSVKLLTGKRITQIIKDNGMEYKLPEDLANLIKKAVNIHDHLSENTRDVHNRRNLQLVEAKIRRLGRYYVTNDVLPIDWKYSIKTAKLLVD